KRMMVAVAVLAGLLGILRGWETHNRRWATWYGKMADEYQLEAVRLVDDFDRIHPGICDLDFQKWTQAQKQDWERIGVLSRVVFGGFSGGGLLLDAVDEDRPLDDLGQQRRTVQRAPTL